MKVCSFCVGVVSARYSTILIIFMLIDLVYTNLANRSEMLMQSACKKLLRSMTKLRTMLKLTDRKSLVMQLKALISFSKSTPKIKLSRSKMKLELSRSRMIVRKRALTGLRPMITSSPRKEKLLAIETLIFILLLRRALLLPRS